MEKTYAKDFEEFLRDWHIELFPQVLDDDLPDSYDNWFAGLKGEDFIKYANIYGKEQAIVGMTKMSEHLNKGNEIIMSAFK